MASDWIAGAFGLGGTAVGGAVTYVTATSSENRRIRREDRLLAEQRVEQRQARLAETQRDALVRMHQVVVALQRAITEVFEIRIYHPEEAEVRVPRIQVEQEGFLSELLGLGGRLVNVGVGRKNVGEFVADYRVKMITSMQSGTLEDLLAPTYALIVSLNEELRNVVTR